LTPWNAFNASIVPATVTFDNGVISETLEQVGLKIQGMEEWMKGRRVKGEG